ncbi:hypothetical protein [Martelella limonii]|uniref:hypothetical protein n=1 Tax=Martelella limonii TaxID=1647649 RepID=UPI0015802C2B|nr:hypothetical protein [Martelella limonii]
MTKTAYNDALEYALVNARHLAMEYEQDAEDERNVIRQNYLKSEAQRMHDNAGWYEERMRMFGYDVPVS